MSVQKLFALIVYQVLHINVAVMRAHIDQGRNIILKLYFHGINVGSLGLIINKLL